MPRTFWAVGLVVAFTLVGCLPGDRSAVDGAAGPERARQPQARKVLVAAALDSVPGFGGWSSLTGGMGSYTEIHTQGLVTTDANGKTVARVTASLPSLDERTMVVLPDGRMQQTWRLRPNVKWHDGAPLTADDVAFSWQVRVDPDLPFPVRGAIERFQNVEALDSTTVVITWRTVYYEFLSLFVTDLILLPKHRLGAAYAGDKDEFAKLPFWSTDWINLGPFRLLDYGLGENLLFEAFDDYFLGRPKLDQIILRTIADRNALVANLEADAIHVVSEDQISLDVIPRLREKWSGTVFEQQGSWAHLEVQFKPEFARPPELSVDVRIRRALYNAMDLDTLREVNFPGSSGTKAGSFMPEADPMAAIVGRPFVHQYDPARSSDLLAQAGWRRRPDGAIVSRDGDRVELNLRSGAGVKEKDNEIIAADWRRLGATVVTEVAPRALTNDPEYRASFPAFNNGNKGPGIRIFRNSFHTRTHATPQNGYRGTNNNGYSNPILDDLIDKLTVTLDLNDQARIGRQLGEILAAELAYMPLYFSIKYAVAGKGVRALDDFPGARSGGQLSRDAHLWDLQ